MRIIDVRPLVVLVAMALGGCASIPAPSYQPSVDVTEQLVKTHPAPMRVGAFSAAPGVENQRLNVRGMMMEPGLDGRYSTFLKEALQKELSSAGLLNAASDIEVSGILTHNDLTAGTGKNRGIAAVGARFVVTRGGQTVYDRQLDARSTWDSSFMGAIALPEAMSNYASGVQLLLLKLVNDPAFQEATRRRP